MMMMMMLCCIFFCHLAVSSSYLSLSHRIHRSSTVKTTALYTDASSSSSSDNTLNISQKDELHYFMDRYHLKTVWRKDHDKKKDMLHLEIYRLATLCKDQETP